MLAAGQNLPSLLDNAGNLIFVVIWILLIVGGVLKNLFKKKDATGADADENSADGVPASEAFAQNDPIEIALAMRDARQKRSRTQTHTAPFPPQTQKSPQEPSDAELRERRRALLLEKQRDAEARLARAYVYAQKLEAQIAEEFPQTPPPMRSRALSAAYAAKNARNAGAKHGPAAEIFSDREALRRAVLAQEVLSPPLALRK